MNLITEPKRTRGKGVKPAMLHVNVRLPQYVVDHFKAGPKYTQEMRRVLTEYVDNEAASRPLEENGDDTTGSD